MAGTPAAGVIGLSNITAWPLTADASGGTPTWGAAFALAGAAELNFDPASSQTPYFGDNSLIAIGSTTGFRKISVKLYDIDPANLATLLGMTYAAGQVLDQGSDTSPYFAIAGKVLRNGSSATEDVVFYKVQLMKLKSDWKTKGATVNFVEVSLDGAAAALTSNGYYMLRQRSDDPNGSATALTNWFTTVQLPTSNNAVLSVVASKTDGSTTLSWTFSKVGGASFSMDPLIMVAANFPVFVAGVDYAGTLSFPVAAGVTQIVKFTPTVAFTGLKANVSVNKSRLANVYDTNGIACTPYSVELSY